MRTSSDSGYGGQRGSLSARAPPRSSRRHTNDDVQGGSVHAPPRAHMSHIEQGLQRPPPRKAYPPQLGLSQQGSERSLYATAPAERPPSSPCKSSHHASHGEVAPLVPRSAELAKLLSADMAANAGSRWASVASARSTVYGGEERSLYGSMSGVSTNLHSSHRPPPISRDSRPRQYYSKDPKTCESCESPADYNATECQICGDPFPPPPPYVPPKAAPPEVVPLSAVEREPMVWLSRGFSIRTPSGPREVRLPVLAQSAASQSSPNLYASAPSQPSLRSLYGTYGGALAFRYDDEEEEGRWL